MKVLLVGGGGREHALAWGIKRSRANHELVCAPGNAGLAPLARSVPVGADEVARLADLADAERADLVVIGPEAPLVAGLADLLASRGHAVFGCSRAAAEIEGSKAFAKAFMARHGIPTAAFGVFSDVAEAELFASANFERGARRLVVKADGLASGKGVVLCDSLEEANHAARAMLSERAIGDAGRRIVIEEFLTGREASLMALVDGERVTPLAGAEDHKTLLDGDRGPMTGGMGAISPTPVLDDITATRALREILEKTARGLAAEGRPFRGLLFAGLMITDQGPRVLEFNCRFGDPETQVVVPRLDEDLAELLLACAIGRLPERVRFKSEAAVCVVMASEGYPASSVNGREIRGLEEASQIEGVIVFHAGTRLEDERVVTAGGRVLGVTALGASVDAARARAYDAVARIAFAGAQIRRDIGARAP